VTDRFVVAVDLTITDANSMKTFASVVRFMEIADVRATWKDLEARVTLRLGGADVTVTPPTHGGQPPQDKLALLDAVTSHLPP